jgi:hypothetical protein
MKIIFLFGEEPLLGVRQSFIAKITGAIENAKRENKSADSANQFQFFGDGKKTIKQLLVL